MPILTTANTTISTTTMPQTNYTATYLKTDRGLFGGMVGTSRMYVDFSLPAITSNMLIDVGMGMSRIDGVLGMVPRWFTMFSPTACPSYQLYTSSKSGSAIMFTFRTYF